MKSKKRKEIRFALKDMKQITWTIPVRKIKRHPFATRDLSRVSHVDVYRGYFDGQSSGRFIDRQRR